MSSVEDASSQQEEVEVLSSMFSPSEFRVKDDQSYEVDILPSDSNHTSPITLSFTFPSHYPSKDMPVYTVHHPHLKEKESVMEVCTTLNSMFFPGEVVIFKWIDWLRDNSASFLEKMPEDHNGDGDISDNEEENREEEIQAKNNEALAHQRIQRIRDASKSEVVPTIYSGEAITDRKSRFQAHIAIIHSLEDVNSVVAELLRNSKIASAAHPCILAYRFMSDGVMHENRDDDGETGAGDRILFNLEKLNCVNVVVVVTRWFGGIMLGGDRFRHIGNVAKAILETKYVELVKAETQTEKKKLRTSEDVYNRIKWDEEWDTQDFIIGYEDRFKGMMEIPFEEFEYSDVPFHRVMYFRKQMSGETMWDRRVRLDKIFTAGK